MKRTANLIVPLILLCSIQTSFAETAENKQLIPTVTIPAPKGAKGFGMPPAGKVTCHESRDFTRSTIQETN